MMTRPTAAPASSPLPTISRDSRNGAFASDRCTSARNTESALTGFQQLCLLQGSCLEAGSLSTTAARCRSGSTGGWTLSLDLRFQQQPPPGRTHQLHKSLVAHAALQAADGVQPLPPLPERCQVFVLQKSAMQGNSDAS